jgi:tRNA 2-thiocytidine biosynthesis protein TtcA
MLSTNKLGDMIARYTAKSSALFEMFPDTGNAVIAFSGGADSVVMTDIMYKISRRWRKNITFHPIMINPCFYDTDAEIVERLKNFCADRAMELTIIDYPDIAKVINTGISKFPPCFTCSRMRRKMLWEKASELNAKTICYAHHRDDLIETFFLNVLMNRRISAMLPVQSFFGGVSNIVRPLIMVNEKSIKRYAQERAFPIIPKLCPYAGNTKRQWIKDFIAQLEKREPGTKANIVRALFHPETDFLLGKYMGLEDKLIR